MMSVEQSVEWELAGETKVLGENLSQRHFVLAQMPHDQTRAGRQATNRLKLWHGQIMLMLQQELSHLNGRKIDHRQI
jgi:hypothetical protein